jgi:hypothetical protein
MAVPMATPAQAIFGLSTCEKVKKKILAFEKDEAVIAKTWDQYAGKSQFNMERSTKAWLQTKWIEIVNLEVKMYALEMNNLKCFTNTQQIYIKEVYPSWKKEQSYNKAYPNWDNGVNANGYYKTITWDSIYNQ